MDMTGLSKYLIDESSKILKKSNIYISSKAYEGYKKCIGMTATMNQEGFYNI
jgi:hypothetical protein